MSQAPGLRLHERVGSFQTPTKKPGDSRAFLLGCISQSSCHQSDIKVISKGNQMTAPILGQTANIFTSSFEDSSKPSNEYGVSKSNVITMSSMEIVKRINEDRQDKAKALGAAFPSKGFSYLRHDSFLIKAAEVLGKDVQNFVGIYFDAYGRKQPCYYFPKREACLMAMSYSYEMQAKVFDEMTALETRNIIKLPDFTNPAAAARAWADAIEASQAIAIERDRAIATKAQIGSKREATAMATASKAVKEVARLKDQLGFSVRQATIMQVEDATGQDYDFLPLRRWCSANEVVAESVPDKRYPKGVKAWPAGAWAFCYDVSLTSLFGEAA